MAEDFKRVKFDRGAFLIKEGERTDDAYLIAKGKVEIRIGAFGRNPHTLAVLEPGDVVGEMSLFDDEPPVASAIALTDTEVTSISRAEFNRRIEAMDPMMRGLLKIMVKRLRHAATKAGWKEIDWISEKES